MADNVGRPGNEPGAGGRWPFAPVGPAGSSPPQGGAGAASGGPAMSGPPTSWSPGGAAPGSSGAGATPRVPGPSGASGNGPDGADGRRKGGRRRPPLWLVIAAAVLVVSLAGVLVYLLLNRSAPVLDPEMVTLPPRTPTVAPVAREAETPFQQALPDAVLEWALAEFGEYDPFFLAGAIESYQLRYTDGSSEIVAAAGQWRTAEEALAAFEAISEAHAAGEGEAADVGEAAEESTPTASGTASPTAPPPPESESGPVEVDGQEVGRFELLPRADGTSLLIWYNQTVVVQVEGAHGAVRDFFAAFPL